MKKLSLLFAMIMITVLSFGQATGPVLIGENWMVSSDVDYSVTPIDMPTYEAIEAPDGWNAISSVADFDATWDLLGNSNFINNKTGHGDYTGPDYFDLDDEATFGASWKAVHKNNMLYILIKLVDTENLIGTEGDFVIEVMSQPLNSLRRESETDPIRWEPTFAAGTDIITKNYAYLRYYELGGYKLEGKYLDGKIYPSGVYGLFGTTATNEWSGVTEVIEMFVDLEEDSFWDKAEDGTQRIVVPMDFDNTLSYPADPENIGAGNPKVALQAGDQIIFDIKTNAFLGAADNENRLEHFWAAKANDGFSHIYHSGLLKVSDISANVHEISRLSEPRVYVHDEMLYVRGSEPVSLEVYNILGAKLKSVKNITQLSLQDLKSGIYLVRINGEGQAVKIIK